MMTSLHRVDFRVLHEITHLAGARTQKGEPASWIYLNDSLYRKAAKAAFFSVVGQSMEEKKDTIEQNITETSDEKVTEVETEQTPEETSDNQAEQTTEEALERPDEVTTEESVETTEDEQDDKPSEESTEKKDDKPSEESTEKKDDKPSEESTEKKDDKPSEESTEKKDDKPSEESAEEKDDKPSEESDEAKDDKPSDDSAETKDDKKDKNDKNYEESAEKKEDKPDVIKEKSSEKKDMSGIGRKKIYIAVAALAVVILAVVIALLAKGKGKKKADPADTVYYTFSEVQKDVAYLANDKEQQDKLNRLIDPMKKSNPIDADYVNSIANIVGADKSSYKTIIKGYSGKDKIPQKVFDEFYDAMIASGKVEGISTTDVFVHSISGTEYGITMISDGYKTYDTDNVKMEGDSRNKIISFYQKNGTIFRVIGLSDAEYTVTNVLLTGIDKDAGTASFLLNDDTVTVKYPDNKPVKELVVNITFTNDGIKSISGSGEEIDGRITAVNKSNLKIHDVGFYYYDDDYKVYDNSGEEPREVTSSQFLVGYKKLKIYVENRRVKAVVITDSELDSEEIRVLINDSEYKGYQLKDVTFSCSSDYTITFSDGNSEEKSSDSKVMFTPASFGMHESVTLSCNDPDARFTIESIERNGLNPSYRGTFEVVMMGDFLYIINKLPIEEYLYAVVSSELSDSYDDETFKAFAVVARGYACKMMESNQFSSYGADIDDSNSTLLYNYYPETERSIMIVNETYGIVPAYEDKIIMPYHFLTSSGITCTNTDIYNEEPQPYYGSNYETVEKEKTLLSSEKSFKYFIDHGNDYDILEVDEPYYRWYIHYTDKEMTDAINSVIDERIKNTVDTVLILEKPEEDLEKNGSDGNKDAGSNDGKSEEKGSADNNGNSDDKSSADTSGKNDEKADTAKDNGAETANDNTTDTTAENTENDNSSTGNKADEDKKKYTDIIENGNFVPAKEGTKIGDVQDVAVVSRSDAGVVKELLIIGSQNTIWVKGQTNVRYILNPVKQIIIKNDGSEVEGYSLMPSPFYYVEKTDDGYSVHGGGFGNGVGLSLSGAEILSKLGYNYDEIIKHYYDNVQLRNMFGLYDKDADKDPDGQDDEASTESTTEE